MSKCFKCNKKIGLLTTVRTLDKADLCNECYGSIANQLTKGLFNSEEVYALTEKQEGKKKDRNDKLRTILRASLLNGDTSTYMIRKFEKELKKHCKEIYNKPVSMLSSSEKTSIINLIFKGYKDTFGDFTQVECNEKSIRDVKGMYYEWLESFNRDLI